MSYCRFSSDNWRSEAYVYRGADGIVIHMAGNRVVGDIPQEPSWTIIKDDPQRFADEYNAVMKFLATAEREDIDLPHAGESFYGLTEGEAAEKLIEMRALGYHIPDGVIEALQDESTGGNHDG